MTKNSMSTIRAARPKTKRRPRRRPRRPSFARTLRRAASALNRPAIPISSILRLVSVLLCLAILKIDTRIEGQGGPWVVKPPAATPVNPASPLVTNLVGLWHVSQSATPVNLVNAALNGTYNGAPAFVPTQDGMGMVSILDADHFEVTDPGHVLDFSTGPFSIGVDFYYGAPAPGAVIIGRGRQLIEGFNVRVANDGVGQRIIAAVNHNPTADLIQTGNVLRIGEINRVLVTFDGSVATIYVNGVNAGSGPYLPPSFPTGSLIAGRDAAYGGFNFSRPITRIMVWRRLIVPAEAATLTGADPYAYMMPPSSTQPAISLVSVGPVTPTSATIGWTTNVPADSFVQYGPTTAYALKTTVDPASVTVHSQVLTGLTPGTLYHYQVVSKDASGAIVASSDSTFTPIAGLAFSDDFNGGSLDVAAWTALNRAGDTAAGELQYYQPGNALVASGRLEVPADADPSEPGFDFTSGMVQWPVFNFRYGTVEVRAKLTGGSGPWPALRLLGSNCQQTNISLPGNSAPCDKPQAGSEEIVIAEVLNSSATAVHQQVRSGAAVAACQPLVSDGGQNWHTYAVVWSPTSLEWKVDGTTTCSTAAAIPASPMFLVMSVAMGASGGPVNQTTLPQSMFVDYVRVYEQTDTLAPVVVGVSPGGGSTGVPLTTTVAARFNESMAPASINGTSVLLRVGATVVPATVSYTEATRTATLAPTALLAPLTTYTVTVKSGASGVTDLAGNPLASDATWSFTTTNDAQPVITSLSQVSGSVGTSITITGSHFGPTAATGSVSFNGATAATTSWTTTSIVTIVPVGATSGPVVVTVGGQASNAVTFTVTVPVPTLTSLSPTTRAPGTTVTIAGTNLVANLLVGKIGWWGPFSPGVPPRNWIEGMPHGTFVGAPPISDGGFTSDASNYLLIPHDAGATYSWTSGAWSAQVDFAFSAAPIFPGGLPVLVVSNGSFAQGTGWEIQLGNAVLNGKYQIMLESNHGIGSYHIVSAYLIVPGALNRAMIVCDEAGLGTWYVNGTAWGSQPCAPSSPSSTGLFVGRYSDTPALPSAFPIKLLQIWNRALTPSEASLSTTTDPTGSLVTFNGTAASPTSYSATTIVTPVPAGASTGPVVVTAAGQASNPLPFSVPDAVPPVVTATTPASGSSGISPGTSVTASFNEAMAAATINSSTVRLSGPGSTPVAATVGYDAVTRTATLIP